MQAIISCKECGNNYNNEEFAPKQLDCEHIICITCALQIFQLSNEVVCSSCNAVTKKNPAFLVTIFIPGAIPNQCSKHNMNKTLFCRDDKITLCIGCAHYMEQHKNHQVVDIQEKSQSLKNKEITQAKQNHHSLKIQMQEILDSIDEAQSNLQKETEQLIQQINNCTKRLVEFIKEKSNEKINILEEQSQASLKAMNKQIKEMKERIQTINEISLDYDDNIIRQLNLLKDIDEITKQYSNLEGKQIVMQYKNNQQTYMNEIEQTFMKILDFEFQEKIVRDELRMKSIKPSVGPLNQWARINPFAQEVYAQFQKVSTIQSKSQIKKDYDIQSKSFITQQTKVIQTDFNWTQVEQISDQKLIVSGG